MVAQVGGLVTDPDNLSYEIAPISSTTTKEVVVDTNTYNIKLTKTGNLTAEGVTLQCLYSFLKEKWDTDANLIFHPFPFGPVTSEQFEMYAGWNFDANSNPTTRVTVSGCNVFAGVTTVTTTQNFNANNVFVNYYVSGSGIDPGTKVVSFSNATMTMSNVAVGSANPTTLTFWGETDYSYNLIRTGGWARKANVGAASVEEWAGIISLGPMGEEGLVFETSVTSTITNSSILTISSTLTIAEGSYVIGPNIPYGARITSIVSNVAFAINKTVSSLPINSKINIRAFNENYYQIGANANALPTTSILPGPTNQPVKIYGDVNNGNFDYRYAANTFSLYSRESGYTFAEATKEDIGYANLTYQVYRFGITTLPDTYIQPDFDSTISSGNVIPATGSPYNNMRIYWYDDPQVRNINGTDYEFNVIIDANILAANTSSTYSNIDRLNVYEFIQWALRRDTNINSNPLHVERIGRITPALAEFRGGTLTTLFDEAHGGVYIDHFKLSDINDLAFTDNNKNTIQYEYIAFNTITFDDNLINDGAAGEYRVFFNQINLGNVDLAGERILGSLKYGTKDAILVKAYTIDLAGDGSYEVKGNLTGNVTFVNFDFAWDRNQQAAWLPNNTYFAGDEYSHNDGANTRWYRVKETTASYISGSTWTTILDLANAEEIPGPTVVLTTIGRENAQYFTVSGTIARSTNNIFAAVSNQELNYST